MASKETIIINGQVTSIDNAILGFLSGHILRNAIPADTWDTMLKYAKRRAGSTRAYRPATKTGFRERVDDQQPLTLFFDALGADGFGNVNDPHSQVAIRFQEGVKNGVWESSGSTPTGYIYTSKVGESGSGTEGAPAKGDGIGQPPGTGAAAEAARKRQIANLEATYREKLMSWGIHDTPSLDNLIGKAAQHGWNLSRWSEQLYDTPEFQDRFPGIFDNKGDLKYSPAQYISMEAQYQSSASQAGVNLGNKKEAWLFANNVSPAEFTVKADAVSMLHQNKALFDAFNEELKTQGHAPLTKQEQFKFIMGEGNQAWEQLWNRSQTLYAAQQAGIQVSRKATGDLALHYGIINKVAGQGLDAATLNADFQEVANNLLTTLPLSRIEGYGLTKKKIVEASFGGPHQAEVKKKIEHIIAQDAAFTDESRAAGGIGTNPQTGAVQTTGPKQRAQY